MSLKNVLNTILPLLVVAEDENHKEHLCAVDSKMIDGDSNKWELSIRVGGPVHLYQVVLNGGYVVYVLANGCKEAISQATCIEENMFGDIDLANGATAQQLPLMVKGWGDEQF